MKTLRGHGSVVHYSAGPVFHDVVPVVFDAKPRTGRYLDTSIFIDVFKRVARNNARFMFSKYRADYNDILIFDVLAILKKDSETNVLFE